MAEATAPQEVDSTGFHPALRPQGRLERFRGSSEVPLSSRGLDEGMRTGVDLARKGGLHELRSSSMGRALQTAQLISRFTHAPITHVGDELHPWHLGALEGHEVTPERVDFINHLVRQEPERAAAGRGPLSTRDGESFNSFKQRALTFMQSALRESAANPDRRIGLVTHFRVKKLMDAWMRKGAQDDLTIDDDLMTSNSGDHGTGGVTRIVNDPYAGPQAFNVDLDSPSQLGGGIYMIRHGATAFNNEQS